MRRLLDLCANAFPLWVLVACGLALVEPGLFTWFHGRAKSSSVRVMPMPSMMSPRP